MDDGAALLRSILTFPAEDTPRLAFADWCDECGEPARAELIRLQVAHSQAWGSHALKAGCRCASCRSFRREEKLLSGDNNAKWAGAVWAPSLKLRWYRGFVETIELPLAAFMAPGVARAIFSEQPVTRVWLIDRAPQADFQNSGMTGWHRFDPQYSADTSGLSAELFGLLDGGKPCVTRDNIKWLDYSTPQGAFAALSVACVRFGRAAAGLSELLPVSA